MELNIKICLDNEAFEYSDELGKCLNQVISYFESNSEGACNIYDSNGNKIGRAEIE